MEHLRAPAGVLHARTWPTVPTVSVLEATGPALVLGSTQADNVVDLGRARAVGVEVVRRRSGGGAVLVESGALWWVDVFVPTEDRLWESDVGKAFHWLGRVWSQALSDLGFDVKAHLGPPRVDRWSSLVCFAGLGPGEVTRDRRKVVGLCQRRTRAGALFQCGALLDWRPAALLGLLNVEQGEPGDAARVLDQVAAGLDVSGASLEEAFLDQLLAC